MDDDIASDDVIYNIDAGNAGALHLRAVDANKHAVAPAPSYEVIGDSDPMRSEYWSHPGYTRRELPIYYPGSFSFHFFNCF